MTDFGRAPLDLPARTLQDAYEAFGAYPVRRGSAAYVDERRTYSPGLTDIQRFERAVERAVKLDRQLDRVPARSWEARGEPGPRARTKLLLSGHRGTGKTSELLSIRERLESDCELVWCRITSYVNQADFHARDLLYVLLGLLVERLTDLRGLARLENEPVAKEAVALLRPRMPEFGIEEVDLNFFGVLKTRIRGESRTRAILRTAAEAGQDALVRLLNRMFRALAAIAERPVLLLMDDLDKLGPKVPGREALFSTDFNLWWRLDVTAIFTLPIDVHHDASFTQVDAARREHGNLIGHVKLFAGAQDRSRFEAGWAVMRAFVERRMGLSLIEPAVLDEAIALSGGSFQQLRMLLREAADYADYMAGEGGSGQIDEAALKHGAGLLRRDFERMYQGDVHVAALRRIHQHQQLSSADDLVYLPSLAVLEHCNDAAWFDVNPLLVPYLADGRDTGKQ